MNIRIPVALATTLLLLAMLFKAAVAQPWMQSPYIQKQEDKENFYAIRDAFYQWWGDRDYEKGKGYMPFKRWEWRMEARCFPDGKLPEPQAYYRAYKEFVTQQTDKSPKNAFWTPLGLEWWMNGYSGYNPGNGRLNAVTIDMNDRNVIYVAAPSGGIWKSIDGGFSWTTSYDTMPVLGTSAIAIHPLHPDTIFIGTGDRDAWDTKGMGVYKSYDGGASWLETGLTFAAPQYKNINKILINPMNPDVIFAASNVGVYRSKNGGANWQLRYNGSGVNDLKFCPGDTSIIYGSGDNFVRSSDGGSTFTKIQGTLPHDTSRLEFDVTVDNPNIVYVVASTTNSTFGGVYRSTDKGLTFSLRSNSPNILGYSDIGDDDAGQAWYDLAIAVSPSNENEVWVGGINMWKSIDGGATWDVNTMWYTGSPYSYIHCDIHSVNFYGDTLYVGSDGGIFFTPDHGSSWQDISAGLGISQFYRMGCSKNDPGHIAAGAQDIGSNVLEDGIWTHVFGADGMEALISHADEDNIYVTYQMGGLLRSWDGGNNFDGVKPVDSIDGGWVTPFVQHPVDALTLYAGYKDVWKTTDGADTWTPLSNNLTNGSNIDALIVAPSNDDYIYVTDEETLYYTSNEGANWSSSVPNAGMYISGITIDPADENRIWLTCTSSGSDRVYHSSDGGQSFSEVTANLGTLGFNCITYQAGTADGLYIGTETGVVYKDSTMANWIPWDTDLPKVPVSELEIHYGTGTLRAATYGRGIWNGPLYNTLGISRITDYGVSIQPNPATDYAIIRTGEFGHAQAEIMLFTVSGKMVRRMTEQGPEIRLQTSGLTPGLYYLGMKNSEKSYYGKLVITR